MRSPFVNVAIISIPKFIKAGAIFVVDVLMAKHLGVENFGLYSFVFAIFLILGVLPRFGLESVLVREKINGHLDRARMSDVLVVRFIGGTVAVVLFLAFAFGNPNLSPYSSMLLYLSLGFWAISLAVFEPMMQSEERFVALAVSQSLVVLVGAAVKVVLIVMDASVGAFWLAILAEVVTGALITLVFLTRIGLVPKPQFRRSGVSSMMLEGAPILMASLSVIAFMRLDQVMLAYFQNTTSVGYYSAALRVSESLFVIATLMSVVLFPRILQMRERDPDAYERMFVLLLRGFFVLGFILAILVGFFAKDIINLLFGAKYSASTLLLQLHCWVLVPAFWGTITHRWIVAEKLARFELIRTGIGLAMNFALNLMLIPIYGAAGACIATLVSQSVAYIAVNFMFAQLRPLARLQLMAIIPISVRS